MPRSSQGTPKRGSAQTCTSLTTGLPPQPVAQAALRARLAEVRAGGAGVLVAPGVAPLGLLARVRERALRPVCARHRRPVRLVNGSPRVKAKQVQLSTTAQHKVGGPLRARQRKAAARWTARCRALQRQCTGPHRAGGSWGSASPARQCPPVSRQVKVSTTNPRVWLYAWILALHSRTP